MTILPTLAESSGLTNDIYKDLHYIIETLKDEPNVEGITKPNLTQWDEEPMVPVLDGNGYVVTTFKAKVEKEKTVFNKAKYKIGLGTWLKQNKTELDNDGKANTSYKENRKTSVKTNCQPDTKLIGETKWMGTKYKQVLRYYQEKDEKGAEMPYLYIWGYVETQKTLETLLTQVHLGNDGKDGDDGTNNTMKNVVDAYTTEN